MSETRKVHAALTIAGSDSGGGAGIQADLKAFARCGVHGTSAITAVTAQNTTGVEAVMVMPPDMIVAQVNAVTSDIRIDAAKVGMLADEATIEAVIDGLELLDDVPVVVDPVMVAESGASLLDPNAKAALIDRMLPRATVATPNLLEARSLAGIGAAAEPADLGRAILALGPQAVIVTGGHSEDGADVLVEPHGVTRIEGPRYPGGATHGSGCTHSAALAAFLARGVELGEAARWAREIAAAAVGSGLAEIGHGPGPVDVFGLQRLRDERLDRKATRPPF